MQNTCVYWSLLTVSALAAFFCNCTLFMKLLLFIVVYVTTFAVAEYVDIFTETQIWKQVERTSACYDWFHHYLKKDYGIVKGKQVFDLTENIYLNDFATSTEKALENKYNLIFKELDLCSGKSLLDCGCGEGSWMEFCKAKGVNVVGLTLSKEQQQTCVLKNLAVHVQDYRTFNETFVGQFDAISLLGSAEHVSVLSKLPTMLQKSYRDFNALFSVLKRYLKPAGKMVLTVLVQNKPKKEFTWFDFVQVYIVQRHYGGYYSKTEVIEKAITDAGFTVNSVKDYTKDYHWISVVEPDHFGHWTVRWEELFFDKVSYLFQGIATDPFLLHHWMYYWFDSWMYHLGGYQKTPLTDDQVRRSLCNLKYLTISV